MVSIGGKSEGSVNRIFTMTNGFVAHMIRRSDNFWYGREAWKFRRFLVYLWHWRFGAVFVLCQQIWQYPTSASIFSSPCVSLYPSCLPSADHGQLWASDDVVLIGSHDHHLYCLSADCGSLRWSCQLDSQVYSSPFIFPRRQQLNTGATVKLTSIGGVSLLTNVNSYCKTL